MTRIRQRITESELAVLKELWSSGPSTIRQLADRLYPGGRAAHYATVQKLLDRLEGKTFVRRLDGAGRARLFQACATRDELIALGLRETADRLCGGSLTPLLSQLVRSVELEPEQLDALRGLVERLERNDDGGPPRE